jgi:hypothetical protein
VIILDVDTIVSLSPDQTLSPTPGSGNTVSFLAPEREMVEYNDAVDIWAAGMVGHELMYGYHPLQLATNPWRSGREHHLPWFKERSNSAANGYPKAKTPSQALLWR